MTTHFGVCLQALLENYGKALEARISSINRHGDLSIANGHYSRAYMESMTLTLQVPRQHGLTTAIRNVYGKRPVMYVTGKVEELLNVTAPDSSVKNTIHVVQDPSVGRQEDGFKPTPTPLYDLNTYKPYFDTLGPEEIPVIIFVDMMHKFERGLKRGRVVNAILQAARGTRPNILFLG